MGWIYTVGVLAGQIWTHFQWWDDRQQRKPSWLPEPLCQLSSGSCGCGGVNTISVCATTAEMSPHQDSVPRNYVAWREMATLTPALCPSTEFLALAGVLKVEQHSWAIMFYNERT